MVGHTRVVCSTFANRGKSCTPESRIEMLEESRALEERRDATQEASGLAIELICVGGKSTRAVVSLVYSCLMVGRKRT